MKKIAIIGLSVLLSACASESYITDVTSESYREDYQSQSISKPIMSSENAVVEKDVEPTVVKMTAKLGLRAALFEMRQSQQQNSV